MGFHSEETFLLHVVVSAILFTTTVYSGSDWPSGWYGLPQPKAHCPSRSEWGSGWWYEDRRLNNQSTARVPQYSHLKGTFTQAITQRYFCMKQKDNELDIPWPNGQYCIYQRLLKPCPPGFAMGSIGWKNSKDIPNHNHHSRNIPSGVFASSTRINYCCKVDGSKENSISLPINRPFFLLAYGSSECQSVKWATTTQEYLRFSVEEKMTFRGFHPFVDDNYALRYCYYQSSNRTLTTPQGTIAGYLNQTSIHQERHTAWHIIPYSWLPFQSLVLRFTRFTFHASNINSYLEVLDGRSESALSLGRFSSIQSPLGQSITSSTNQLLVILHFGDRSGTYDFEFNYDIYLPPGSDWPSGWYGLPQPKAGCPSRYEWWDNGWWYEDRRLNNQSTARLPQYSHLRGTFTQAITKRYFCIKKKDNGLDIPWPNGQYCIYQRLLKPCPPGFFKGSIGWKNSKDVPNHNDHSGNLNIPSGVFASSTRINYCCKVDGSKENGISLPIYRPFFLLAYGSSECQSVKWATTTQEYLRFSVQEKMTFRGFHPFVDDNYALRYCYYQSSNRTLTKPQGTISGYLNQTSVHQERYTAWHIIPVAYQFLVVRFTRFTFHASNISSYLEVLDGRSESAPSLGRFSSTQSPLGQSITSSTNQLFVVLHFGDRSGTYDFEFNYDIYSPPVSTTAEIKTPSHPPTSSSTKMTSSSPYTSSSKVTSLPSTTHSTGTHLHSHGNDMLLLYTLLSTGGIVLIIIIIIGVMIVRRQRKRTAYSRLTSLSIDEIVSELNDTSCAVSSDKHRAETGMTTRTRLKLMDTTSDSDDEMINLDRNPPDFPSTELHSL